MSVCRTEGWLVSFLVFSIYEDNRAMLMKMMMKKVKKMMMKKRMMMKKMMMKKIKKSIFRGPSMGPLRNKN